jgi:phage shock protein E
MTRFPSFLVLVFGLLGLVLTGCKDNSGLIDGARAHDLVKQGALLLDVRTPMEYSRDHIDGATNIPLSLLDENMSKLDKSRPIVVYCQSGTRSKVAKSALSSMGFTVYDLGAYYNW